MFKFLGKALGHSFGLVTITLGSILWLGIGEIKGISPHYDILAIIDGIYVGGYALLPASHLLNEVLKGVSIRREIRKQMRTPEAKEKLAKKVDKTLNKEIKKMSDKEIFDKSLEVKEEKNERKNVQKETEKKEIMIEEE